MRIMKNTAAVVAAIILTFFATACPIPGQDPSPDAPVVEPDTPVAAGLSTVFVGDTADAFGMRTAGHWSEGVWHPYEGSTSATIRSAIALDGDIIAIGYDVDIGGVIRPRLWKNGVAHELETPTGMTEGYTYQLAIVDSRIIVAGYAYIPFVEGAPRYGSIPGYWLDGSWHELTIPGGGNYAYAIGIAARGPDVLICGYVSGGPATIWENGIARTLDLPAGAKRGYPRSIAVGDDGTEYCAGYVTYADAFDQACLWVNGLPTLLAKPTGTMDAAAYGVSVEDGEPIVTGVQYKEIAGRETMTTGFWKAGAWIELSPAAGKSDARAYSSVASSPVFAGYCTDAEGRSIPGFWSEGEWNALPLPDGAVKGSARALITSDSSAPSTPQASGKIMVYTAGTFYDYRPILDANGELLYEYEDIEGNLDPDLLATYATAVRIDNDDIYFCGSKSDTKFGVAWPAYWKNGVRTDIALPDGSLNGTATDIAIAGTKIYVAGYYKSASLAMVPFIYEDGIRTDLEVSQPALGGRAFRIAAVGSDVYVSGYSVTANGPGGNDDTWELCYWKNAARNAVRSVTGLPELMVVEVAASGSDVYLGGACESGGNIVPAYWMISGASPEETVLPAGSATKAGIVGLLFDGPDIYATGGTFTDAGGWMPVVWKNGILSELGIVEAVPGDNSLQVGISIAVDGPDVYIAGMRYSPDADYSGEVPALWKNGKLIELSESSVYGTLMDIAVRKY